jgi:hypothetical protein
VECLPDPTQPARHGEQHDSRKTTTQRVLIAGACSRTVVCEHSVSNGQQPYNLMPIVACRSELKGWSGRRDLNPRPLGPQPWGRGCRIEIEFSSDRRSRRKPLVQPASTGWAQARRSPRWGCPRLVGRVEEHRRRRLRVLRRPRPQPDVVGIAGLQGCPGEVHPRPKPVAVGPDGPTVRTGFPLAQARVGASAARPSCGHTWRRSPLPGRAVSPPCSGSSA